MSYNQINRTGPPYEYEERAAKTTVFTCKKGHMETVTADFTDPERFNLLDQILDDVHIGGCRRRNQRTGKRCGRKCRIERSYV